MFQVLYVGITALLSLSIVKASSRKYYDMETFDTKGASNLIVYNSNCISLVTILFLMFYGFAYFLKGQISTAIGIPSTWVLMAVLVAYFNILAQFRLSQWQVRLKALNYGAFQFCIGLVNLSVSIVLVVFLSMNSEGRVLGILYTGMLSGIFALFFLNKDDVIRFGSMLNFNYVKEIVTFGLPLLPHAVGFYLLSFSDRFIINEQLGVKDTGIYLAALQLSMVLHVLFSSFDKAFLPWLFAKLKANRELTEVVKITYLLMIGFLIIAWITFYLSPFLVLFILGAKYLPAANFIGYLFLGQVFYGMYLLVANYIFYAKKNAWISTLTITSGIFHVSLTYLFVNLYGLVGVGYAFTLSKAMQFIGAWFLAIKSYPMPWFKFRG
jgi:O-antigen/teichoic acid export membrane protein